MTEKDVFDVYHKSFRPIYADLIAVVGYKPEQVIFELEAAFSHLATAYISNNNEIIENNFRKARNHLHRASLDSSKILWLEYRKRVNKFVNSGDLRKFATNCSESDFIAKYQEAEASAIDARRHELKNVGIAPEIAIEKYYNSAILFQKLLGLIDPEKEKYYASASRKWKSKEVFISFFMGIVSSFIVSLFFYYCFKG